MILIIKPKSTRGNLSQIPSQRRVFIRQLDESTTNDMPWERNDTISGYLSKNITLPCRYVRMLFSSLQHHKVKKESEPNLPSANKINKILEYQTHGNKILRAQSIQPPPSVPSAAGHNPDATIAAGPEEDPPVYLSVECGFLVVL